MDYSKLTDREIDADVATKIMGLDVWFERGRPTTWRLKDPRAGKGEENREPVIWLPNDYVTWDTAINPTFFKDGKGIYPIDSYSTDLNHAATVDARIKELALELRYAATLHLLLDEATPNLSPGAFLFAVATATARQRCETALRCLEER